ncbi:MAG: low temperature requirement protein A, partial [Leucobacter sp.]|nr:low temperature requirement protein A [Leucobacter sp.]
MRPRDPAQVFRASSPLELFFDLIFVVAVSFSATQLHHSEHAGEVGAGILGYLIVFFAIWWAWMN